MEDLIRLIKDKDEFRGLSDDYVKDRLQEFIDEYPGFMDVYEERSLKQFQRSIEYKIMLKDVRAQLRETYGVFFIKKTKKLEDALQRLKKNPSIENHIKLLSLHRSSKERLAHYEKIYKQIFEITGKPEKILDLGCGFNPISYPFMGCEPDYVASDISPFLQEFLTEYFEAAGVNGEARVDDLLKLPELPAADICFLFKALDSLETIERDISEKLLEKIKCKLLVVSFPRQSIGGSAISDSKRSWFDRLLANKNWEHETFSIPNESFYVVKK